MPIVPFRDLIKSNSVPWMRDGTGERLLYVFGLMMDARLEKVVQGTLARFPLRAQADANAITGRDRDIERGITEADGSYAVRLQKAFDSWRMAGTARGVLVQVLGFLLSSTPAVRFVSSRYETDPARLQWYLENVGGFRITGATNATPIVITTAAEHGFTTGDSVRVTGVLGNVAANATWTITVASTTTFSLNTSVGSGAYTSGGRAILASDVPTPGSPPDRLSSQWDSYAAGADPDAEPVHVYTETSGGNWDWDSLSQVTGSWGWYQGYLIVYAVAPNDWAHAVDWTWDLSPPTWDEITGTWDTDVEPEVIESIRRIAGKWKSANTWIRFVLIVFDGALFDPAEPAGGGINPDGYFGRWTKLVAGVYVPARYEDVAYCDGIA